MKEVEKNEALILKRDLFNLWKEVDPKVREKFNNLNGKTGQYGVPDTLFQKRTSRKNRVLIPWKTIVNNNITIDQLKTFLGGVCVEFVNYDFFSKKYENNKTHIFLKNLLGSNGMISSIISFRTEDGDSGASIARNSYKEFESKIKNTKLEIKPIQRNPEVSYIGRGDNSVWEGNIYISIKGGDQTSIESHADLKDQLLFNPAIDYANEDICLDIDISMSFFALHCHDLNIYATNEILNTLKNRCKLFLSKREYDTGNLYDYCINHPSIVLGDGYLIDAIQLDKISISNFKTSGLEESSVICHDQAANKELFYFDNKQQCILSPARPSNFFWSTHLSNMMQQNYSLREYFEKEKDRYLKRESILNKKTT